MQYIVLYRMLGRRLGAERAPAVIFLVCASCARGDAKSAVDMGNKYHSKSQVGGTGDVEWRAMQTRKVTDVMRSRDDTRYV